MPPFAVEAQPLQWQLVDQEGNLPSARESPTLTYVKKKTSPCVYFNVYYIILSNSPTPTLPLPQCSLPPSLLQCCEWWSLSLQWSWPGRHVCLCLGALCVLHWYAPPLGCFYDSHDLFNFLTATRKWECRETTGPAPKAQSLSAIYWEGRLVLFGGVLDGEAQNLTYILNIGLLHAML